MSDEPQKVKRMRYRILATMLAVLGTHAAASAADRVYLSDFLGVSIGSAATAANPPFTAILNGAIPYGFGADCPGNFASSKITLFSAGAFEKGIGQHPFQFGEKTITFSLPALRVATTRDLAVFQAVVGVDFTSATETTGGFFNVYVDGVLKRTAEITGKSVPPIEVNVSVLGASTLTLGTVTRGNFQSNHLCWGGAWVTLDGGPCAADVNGDRLVDDADFTIFAGAYNILDCADPAMPLGCPADLNKDSLVDDLDFQLFAVAYDALLCP